MSVTVTTAEGGSVELSEDAFGRAFNEALVHQVVVAWLAGARAGTRAHKNRSSARGGGRKPWRQKGTNRARSGTIRSPIWRGGGRTFAASPQDHSQKVNRKMYRGALACIVSELIRQNRLLASASLDLDAPRTKTLLARLDELLPAAPTAAGEPAQEAAESGTNPNGAGRKMPERLLIVSEEVGENLYLASRNVPNLQVIDVDALDPVSLVSHDRVLIDVGALKKIEERLQ